EISAEALDKAYDYIRTAGSIREGRSYINVLWKRCEQLEEKIEDQKTELEQTKKKKEEEKEFKKSLYEDTTALLGKRQEVLRQIGRLKIFKQKFLDENWDWIRSKLDMIAYNDKKAKVTSLLLENGLNPSLVALMMHDTSENLLDEQLEQAGYDPDDFEPAV
ncbi:MAG: hypothetical protein ABEJ72_03140, partial [Candidatus Aenigmatarchaeota archaeon]